jgi:hypothetical protein
VAYGLSIKERNKNKTDLKENKKDSCITASGSESHQLLAA